MSSKEAFEAKKKPKAKKDTAAALFDDDNSSNFLDDDLGLGKPLDFGFDSSFDSSFKLDLFSGSGGPKSSQPEKKANAGENPEEEPDLESCKKEVLPNFVHYFGVLMEQRNRVAMKLMHNIRHLMGFESTDLRTALLGESDLGSKLKEWVGSLTEATDISFSRLMIHLLDTCSALEKFRAFGELTSGHFLFLFISFLTECFIFIPHVEYFSESGQSNVSIFEAILSKARTLSTILFSFKIEALHAPIEFGETILHLHSFLWSSSRFLISDTPRRRKRRTN